MGTLLIKKKPEEKPKVKPKSDPFVWPSIVYNGTVSNQNSKEKISVLTINGQQHIMKVGQTMNGVKLLRANNKEILISYKGTKKTIAKL